MSSVKITPSLLRGEIAVPPSKSAAHRAIICAALSNGVSHISPIELSSDIKATIEAVTALGAEIHYLDGALSVDGSKVFSKDSISINCVESGSTLRFLMPIVAASGITAEFDGKGRLPQRPIGTFAELFPLHGVTLSATTLPLTSQGKLTAGKYTLRGDISSQFITGLLFALPLLENNSEIELTTPLESSGYVDMTIDIMAQFGVKVTETQNGYFINGSQQYKEAEFYVEGDWSQAAFFLAAGTLGGDITITNLNPASKQGDKAAEDLFRKFGAAITWENGHLHCKGHELNGQQIDASQIPDLVPALAVTAAFAKGETRIYNAGRLRIKESDRIKTVCDGLHSFKAEVFEQQDGMRIHGVPLSGGTIDGSNDHRIVMAFSVLATAMKEPCEISDIESINKSYPTFFEEFKRLGGITHVVNDR